MGIDSFFSFSVTVLQLAQDFIPSNIPTRQKTAKQLLDVRARQKRIGIDVLHAQSQHEKHRHHDKGHMMTPHRPFSDLVVRHAAFAFGVFKDPFHPKALKLHPGQCRQLGRFGRIARRYFNFRIISKRLCGDQRPLDGRIRPAVPSDPAPNRNRGPSHNRRPHPTNRSEAPGKPRVERSQGPVALWREKCARIQESPPLHSARDRRPTFGEGRAEHPSEM